MENETNRKKLQITKNQNEKQRVEDHTNATLPIHYNVVIVRKGRENDGEELGAFFTSTSPGHPVFPHRLVFCINKAIEPTISLKIVTHVFKVRGADIQNILITHEHLDEELASLQEI